MVCIWRRICFAGENGTNEDFHFVEKHVRAMKLNYISNTDLPTMKKLRK